MGPALQTYHRSLERLRKACCLLGVAAWSLGAMLSVHGQNEGPLGALRGKLSHLRCCSFCKSRVTHEYKPPMILLGWPSVSSQELTHIVLHSLPPDGILGGGGGRGERGGFQARVSV